MKTCRLKLPFYTLSIGIEFIGLIAIILFVLLLTAGYSGPQRPDGILCENVGLIASTLQHQTKAAGWFYSFDRSFTSTIQLPTQTSIAMFDADYTTTVKIGGQVGLFNTGNETWSNWWEPIISTYPISLSVIVPDKKPSSNLCFHRTIPISHVEATPIPDATEIALPTPVVGPGVIYSVTVWVSPTIPVLSTPDDWVPTSLDEGAEFSIHQAYLPQASR